MRRLQPVFIILCLAAVSTGACGGGDGTGDAGRLDVPVVPLDLLYTDGVADDEGAVDPDVWAETAVEAGPEVQVETMADDAPGDAGDDSEADPEIPGDVIDDVMEVADVPDVPDVADVPVGEDLAVVEAFDAEDGAGEAVALCAPSDTQCVCTTDEDCDPAWSGFCGKNSCNKSLGTCLVAPVQADGTPCEDGDPCTLDDGCKKGLCTGAPNPCDDGSDCTADGCESGVGCVNVPVQGACEDGDFCHGPDTCLDGACTAGPAVVCDDKNDCTADDCAPGSGCTFVPAAGPCDDGNECTDGDHCEAGGCSPTGFTDCDDGNPCTVDGCDPATGCVNTESEGSCDDGDTCTQGDFCQGGVCMPGPVKQCFVCGDDECDPDEDCQDCPEDCGDCPPDCQTTTTIGCGGMVADTTVGFTNAMESYFNLQCISLLPETGPERVVPFQTGEDVWVNAVVKTGGLLGLDLWVLGTNCQASSCVAQSGLFGLGAETLFKPDAGKTYYLTVDSGGTSGASFTLEAQCLEAACGDGQDNDGDGVTDCSDGDCSGAALTCGGSVDGDIDRYSHAGGYSATCGNQSGGKYDAVFHFTLEQAATVTIVADPDDSGDDLDVFVLKDGCTGAACVAYGIGSGTMETVVFAAQPGTYTVVVEEDSATEDSNGNFTLTLNCQPL